MPAPRPGLRKNRRIGYESAQALPRGAEREAGGADAGELAPRRADAGKRPLGGPEALVASIAATQHGNVTRRQLLSTGITERSIMRRVQRGRLYREYAGVYSVGRPAVTPVERAAAAVLACGPQAALSHASAMVLWGFWQRWSPPFEISVLWGCPRPSGIAVHRSVSLTPDDVVVHLAIPVTSPSRTIHDIAPACRIGSSRERSTTRCTPAF